MKKKTQKIVKLNIFRVSTKYEIKALKNDDEGNEVPKFFVKTFLMKSKIVAKDIINQHMLTQKLRKTLCHQKSRSF